MEYENNSGGSVKKNVKEHVSEGWKRSCPLQTNKARQVARENTSYVNCTIGRLKEKADELIDVHQCMRRSDKDVDSTGKFLNKIATKI